MMRYSLRDGHVRMLLDLALEHVGHGDDRSPDRIGDGIGDRIGDGIADRIGGGIREEPTP
jgi:hypothetical protein